MRSARGFVTIVIALLLAGLLPQTPAEACEGIDCDSEDTPAITFDPGAVDVSHVSQTSGGYEATNDAPPNAPYTYRLISTCVERSNRGDICRPGDDQVCPVPPDRIVQYLVIEQRRLAQEGGTSADGTPPPAGTPVGTAFGTWLYVARSCVDVTAINPPPTPDEVLRYFQTLPLPTLTTQQQPPGTALVGLPVIFFTQTPPTAPFTVTIRGFQVAITATVTTYTWHPGDGSPDLVTDQPGAPYPYQTITHDYASGTWTASLTATWGASYTVDGGPTQTVPGTTTTDGPAVTFTVLEARAVLTDPYD